MATTPRLPLLRHGERDDREQKADGSLGTGQTFEFDLRDGGSVGPTDHAALAAMAHEDEDPTLTYLVKIDGIEGTSTLEHYAGYFEVDAFTFGELTALASGGGGSGSGKAVFNPLMIDIDGLSPGLVELLGSAASGEHIRTVDLVGLKIAGGRTDEVYHLKLDDATVSGVAIDGDDTAVAFNFRRVTETIKEQNPDGSIGTGQTFEFDLRVTAARSLRPTTMPLAAMAHEDEDPALPIWRRSRIDGTPTCKTIAEYIKSCVHLSRWRRRLKMRRRGVPQCGIHPLMIENDACRRLASNCCGNAVTARQYEIVDLRVERHEWLVLSRFILKLTCTCSRAIMATDRACLRLQQISRRLGCKTRMIARIGQSFQFELQRDGGTVGTGDHDALAAMAHEDEDPGLTYLVKIDGIEGTSKLDHYAGYFEVDAFTFGELTSGSGSGGGVGGSGKAVFDPLMVDLDGVSPGLTSLLGNAAAGAHIRTVELVGLKITGDNTSEVYHLKLDDATVSGVAIDGHDTAVAFNFKQVTETIREQKPDGSLDPGKTFSFDLGRDGGSINPVDHDALAAMVHAHHDVLLV